MVNYHIGEKDQKRASTSLLLRNSLCSEMLNVDKWEMTPLLHDFQHGYMRNLLETRDKDNKRYYSSNTCASLCRSLKLLTADRSDFLAVLLKADYMLLCNLRGNLVEFLANYM